jgi:hypothetical protein
MKLIDQLTIIAILDLSSIMFLDGYSNIDAQPQSEELAISLCDKEGFCE